MLVDDGRKMDQLEAGDYLMVVAGKVSGEAEIQLGVLAAMDAVVVYRVQVEYCKEEQS